MKKDLSYGIIPLRKIGKTWEVFIIKHVGGHWGFPKGHPEIGESPKEAAERELKEETGLTIEEFFPFPPFVENYIFFHRSEKIDKTVTYYPAKVSGTPKLQLEELQDGRWTPLEQATEHLTFPEGKAICRKALERLTNLSH